MLERTHLMALTMALGGGLIFSTAELRGAQLIWLDFDSASSPASPDHSYTTTERDAIEAALAGIFAPWGHTFTQTDPAPTMATKIEFNDGGFGTSTAVDFRNLITDIDLAAVDAGFALDGTGKPRTSANIVQASINLATHELQHLLGARHHDAYNPVGAGAGGAGTSSTFQSLTTVLGIDGDRILAPDLFISPRTAMKLEFAAAGSVVPEGPEPNDSFPTAAPIMRSDFLVPNTLPPGEPMSGLPLVAVAVDVLGALDGGGGDLIDYYVFDGKAGEIVSIELMSDVIDHRLDEFDSKLELLDMFGTPLAGIVTDSIDGPDPTLLDYILPADGPYFIEVTAEGGPLLGVGEYELLVYGLYSVPEPASAVLLVLGGLTVLLRPRRSSR